jgi:hypothetical protein
MPTEVPADNVGRDWPRTGTGGGGFLLTTSMRGRTGGSCAAGEPLTAGAVEVLPDKGLACGDGGVGGLRS